MPDYREQYGELISEVAGLVAEARACCIALVRTKEGAPPGFNGDLSTARSDAAERLSAAVNQVLDFTGRVNSIPRLLDGGRKFPDYVAYPDGARMLEMMGRIESLAPAAKAFEMDGPEPSMFTPALPLSKCESLFDELERVIDGISEVHNGSSCKRPADVWKCDRELGALIEALA